MGDARKASESVPRYGVFAVSAERRRGQMKDWPGGAHIELIKARAVSGYLPAASSHLRTQTDRQASLRIRVSNTEPVTPVPVLADQSAHITQRSEL